MKGSEEQLFDAITNKDIDKVRQTIKDNPSLNLNCLDKDELTPLQHACHIGNIELARLLLENGADVNFTQRKDGYTPLMFAAISSREDIVRLLLERHVDINIENCVNRTAAQMAAFVGQSKIVQVINSWISYEGSVEPYTRCRELEDEPRIPSKEMGHLLHSYVVYPSQHPIKLLLYIKDNIQLVELASKFIYVLENLSSKALRPPQNDETLSLKYYYLSHLLECCRNKSTKEIECNIRRLIKRDESTEMKICTPQLDRFILNCIVGYPYTQLEIFKTILFALGKRESGDLNALIILTQTLNGPRMFGQAIEACIVCGEIDKNKRCSGCKSVYYCGPSCQRIDWFQHKKACKL